LEWGKVNNVVFCREETLLPGSRGFVVLACLVETGLRVETSQVEGETGSCFKKYGLLPLCIIAALGCFDSTQYDGCFIENEL